MSKQNFKPRTDPEKCRRGCGMMVYLDFVNPEGKTDAGKFRPLVYYEEDNNFSGIPHDCPKSEYNQKKAQGQTQSTSTSSTATPTKTISTNPQEELYKYLGDVVSAISQRLDQMNNRIEEVQRMVRTTIDSEMNSAVIIDRLDKLNQTLSTISKTVLMNQSLADTEAIYDQDKEDGIQEH